MERFSTVWISALFCLVEVALAQNFSIFVDGPLSNAGCSGLLTAPTCTTCISIAQSQVLYAAYDVSQKGGALMFVQ